MKAWIFQDHRQKQKLGDKAPWSVGWTDPDGKRRSKSIGSRSMAQKFARRVEGKIAAGCYENESRKTWSDFMVEFESRVLAIMEPRTRESTQDGLNHFERVIRPTRLRSITSTTIADYIAVRRLEKRGRKVIHSDGKSERLPVSPATINKELRTIRAALRKAERWGYLPKMPVFEFLRVPAKLPTYVTPEHFQAIYTACESARWPQGPPYAAADWWRGLIVAAYMTGWRISSLLALRREDVDLQTGIALSRAQDNKGRRDQQTPLHPLVIEHLQRLQCFSPLVFPWARDRRRLFEEFKRIQSTAGIKPPGEKSSYGFHDLRRAFATMNADRMTADALQALMQHRDYQTTQRYINMARQLNPAVANLYVPKLANVSAG